MNMKVSGGYNIAGNAFGNCVCSLPNCTPHIECGNTWHPFQGSASSPAGAVWLQIRPWLQWSTPPTASTRIQYRYIDDNVDYLRPSNWTPLVARIDISRCTQLFASEIIFINKLRNEAGYLVAPYGVQKGKLSEHYAMKAYRGVDV
jgi:hypothetical protein